MLSDEFLFISNPLKDLIDNIYNNLKIKQEDAIRTGFEKCGYSEDWVIANSNRISVVKTVGCTDIVLYCIDDEKLFEIRQKIDVNDKEITVSHDIRFYVDIEKEES